MDVSKTKYYPGNCSIRCSLKIIRKIHNILRVVPKRLELFSETCFADWLKLENFRNEPHLVHLILQCQSGSDDSLRNVYFSIHGTEFTFGAKEFCLVTGFKFGNTHLTPNVTNPSFVDRVFKDNRDKVKLQELKDVFRDRLNELNDEDVVRVCLLLLVELGFKGTEAKNNLDIELLDLVNDLKAWNDYPWGSYLWDITYGQLKNALSKNHRDDPQRRSRISYSLKGFIFAFKTWILEIFPAFKSIAQNKILIPRAVGWHMTTPITWDKALHIFRSASEVSSMPVNIYPTPLEEKTDWLKCSLCILNGKDFIVNKSQGAKMRRGAENIIRKTLYGFLNHIKLINISIELIVAEIADQKTTEDLLKCLNNQENELFRIQNHYVKRNESGSNLQYHDSKTSFLDARSDVGEVGDIDLTGSVMPVNVYPTSLEEITDEDVCIVKEKTRHARIDGGLLNHLKVLENIIELVNKGSVHKKAAEDILTYLDTQEDELFRLLTPCVERYKSGSNLTYHDRETSSHDALSDSGNLDLAVNTPQGAKMGSGADNITDKKTLYGILNHIKLIGITAELVMASMVDQKTTNDLRNCLNNLENELYRLHHYYVQQIESGSNLQYHDPKTFLDALLDGEVGDINLKVLVISESVSPTSLEDKTNEEVCMVKNKPKDAIIYETLDGILYHYQMFKNFLNHLKGKWVPKKAAKDFLTYLDTRKHELFRLLNSCVERYKSGSNLPYHGGESSSHDALSDSGNLCLEERLADKLTLVHGQTIINDPTLAATAKDIKKSAPLAKGGQNRQIRPTTTSYSRHRVPKTSDKVKHVESIKYKVEDMIDKGIEIQLSFHSSEYLTKEFWVQLLVIHSNGWFTSDHIRVWNSYMYFSRPRNARWTLMPPDFVHFVNRGSKMKHLANGSLAPYPPIADVDIMYIPLNINKNHWILLRVDILNWTITVYDSLRDKRMDPTYDPELTSLTTSLSHWLNINVNRDMKIQTLNKFSYIIPEKLAQQVNGMDCGVWCCIFLERLIEEKEIFIEEDQDPTKTAQEFRERFALLCLEHVDKSKYLEGHVSKATPTGDDNPPTISVVGDNTSSPTQQATGVSIGSFPNLVALEAAPKKEEVKLAAQKRKAAEQGAPASKHSVKFDFSELQSPTRKKCRLEDSVYGVEQQVLAGIGMASAPGGSGGSKGSKLVKPILKKASVTPPQTFSSSAPTSPTKIVEVSRAEITKVSSAGPISQAPSAFVPKAKAVADVQVVICDPSPPPLDNEENVPFSNLHNPRDAQACHVPNWRMTQNNWFTDPNVYESFLAHAAPPAEHVFQRTRLRPGLITENAMALSNAISTTAEMVQEGVMFQEDLDLVEAEKKKFEEGRLVEAEKLRDAEWRLATLRGQKDEVEKSLARREAEWKTYYTDTNEKMQAAFELEQKLRADMYEVEKEVAKLREVIESRDVMVTSLRDTLKTKEAELLERDEQVVEIEAISGALADESKRLQEQVAHLTTEVISLKEDRTWLLKHCIPEVVQHVKSGKHTMELISELIVDAKLVGRKEGFAEGYKYASEKKPDDGFPLQNIDFEKAFRSKSRQYDRLKFPLVDFIVSQADKPDLEELKTTLTRKRINVSQTTKDIEMFGEKERESKK